MRALAGLYDAAAAFPALSIALLFGLIALPFAILTISSVLSSQDSRPRNAEVDAMNRLSAFSYLEAALHYHTATPSDAQKFTKTLRDHASQVFNKLKELGTYNPADFSNNAQLDGPTLKLPTLTLGNQAVNV